jgi:hypothetical protein
MAARDTGELTRWVRLESGGWLPIVLFVVAPALAFVVAVAARRLCGRASAPARNARDAPGRPPLVLVFRTVAAAAVVMCALGLSSVVLLGSLGAEVFALLDLPKGRPFESASGERIEPAYVGLWLNAAGGHCDLKISVNEYTPRWGHGGGPGPSPRGFWVMPFHDDYVVSGAFIQYVSRLRIGGWLPCSIAAVWLAIIAVRKFRWWRRERVGDGPWCESCGYNLTGNVSGRCPECGTAIAPAAGS